MTMTISGSGTITGISQGGLNDNIITQSELANTGVAGNGPAFSAYQSSNTSVSNATTTKIAFNTTSFDTASCFNTTLNRYVPNVAGYYQISLVARDNTGPAASAQIVYLYKNGSIVAETISVASGSGVSTVVSALVYMNGSTDYLEGYYYQASGGTTQISSSSYLSYFQGCLVRAA